MANAHNQLQAFWLGSNSTIEDVLRLEIHFLGSIRNLLRLTIHHRVQHSQGLCVVNFSTQMWSFLEFYGSKVVAITRQSLYPRKFVGICHL